MNWKRTSYNSFRGRGRKTFLQHASAKFLVEEGLINENQLADNYKLPFVRNSWERVKSDYFWLKKDQKVTGSINGYLSQKGASQDSLTQKETLKYRGDYLYQQTSFFGMDWNYQLNLIWRFESLKSDFNFLFKN